MKTAALEKQTVHAGGFYGTEVDLEFKTPVERIYFEKGRTTPMFPCEEEVPMLLYVRAEVDTALTKETEFWILPGGTAADVRTAFISGFTGFPAGQTELTD